VTASYKRLLRNVGPSARETKSDLFFFFQERSENMDTIKYTNNDVEAIYTRGVIANIKNWRKAWAIRQARKGTK